MVSNLVNKSDHIIEISGIPTTFPSNMINFKQFIIQGIVQLPNNTPYIKKLLRLTINPKIIKTKVISTPKTVSYEGKILTGEKLVVQGELLQRIDYITDTSEQTIHTINFKKYFSNYIVLKENLNISSNLSVDAYIEHVHVRQISNNKFYESIILLLNVA